MKRRNECISKEDDYTKQLSFEFDAISIKSLFSHPLIIRLSSKSINSRLEIPSNKFQESSLLLFLCVYSFCQDNVTLDNPLPIRVMELEGKSLMLNLHCPVRKDVFFEPLKKGTSYVLEGGDDWTDFV